MTSLAHSALRIAAVQLDALPNRIAQQQRVWIPEEPLFGPEPLSDTSLPNEATIAHLASQHPEFLSTRRTIANLYTEAVRARLLRVLEFCQQHQVHLVVFPEYSIPPALIPVLVGYSSDMIIVAGVGLVRPVDIERVQEPLRGKLQAYTNCAVVVGPKFIEVISKQHPSEGEYMEAGDGPSVQEVVLRDRTFRLGVAICMDYIHIGHSFGPAGGTVDVVAIPALSRTTEVFYPDQPRDFVRVIANHANCGGTRILLPKPAGAAFTTDAGTTALGKGEEGVIIADFDKFQSAPRSTFSTNNRIIARTSLLSSPSELEQRIVEAMQALPLELSNNSEASQMVDAWIERTAEEPRLGGLRQCLIEYKRLATSEVLRKDDHRLLSSHLLAPEAKTSSEVRAAQCREVSATLRSLVNDESDPSIFDAQRVYASMLTSVRTSRKQHGLSVHSKQQVHTYFALGLGRYDSDDAKQTIPYQLDLLRAFGISFDSSYRLCYRVTTEEIAATQDKGAHFEIMMGGFASKDATLDHVEQFARAFRAILVSGWSCYSSDAEIDASATYVYVIEPSASGALGPAIRADWGVLTDVLRAEPTTIALDLICLPLAAEPATSQLDDQPSSEPVSPTLGAGDTFAEFLRSQAFEHRSDAPSLELRILVSSSHEVSDGLLSTIGSILLGHDRFTTRSYATSNRHGNAEILGFKVRPDEALRVVHPPHGHIEGRGLGARGSLNLYAKDVPIAQKGCVIGRAVAARAYVDTRFDLAIEDESRLRHVYVIGKTGSGKTNLLKNMVRQDIASGAGVVVIDPHGDLAEYALGHCGSRVNDCLYLDFADREFLPILNPLSLDVISEAERLLAVEELLEVFTKRTYHEFYGPRFEDTVRMALDTLYYESPTTAPSILDVPRLLRDKTARQALVRSLPGDSSLHDRWKVFDAMRDTEQAEVINWVLAKFAEIEQSEVLRSVLVAGESSFSLVDVVAHKKVLIVRLPESAIGSRAASLLGSLLVAKISRHIVEGRANQPADARESSIFMHVDEFQKFVGSGFESLIAEARKFGLGLVLAHQNTDQLRAFSRYEGARDSSVLTQILGNVGTIICFRIGSRDAERIGPELGIKSDGLLRVGRYEAVARVVADGIEREPVTISVYDSAGEPGFPETRERVRENLRTLRVLRSRKNEGLKPDSLDSLPMRTHDGDTPPGELEWESAL